VNDGTGRSLQRLRTRARSVSHVLHAGGEIAEPAIEASRLIPERRVSSVRHDEQDARMISWICFFAVFSMLIHGVLTSLPNDSR
jgi:hypothetical protein